MTKSNVLIISVIVLAILNITTLGFMYMHKPHHKRGHATCQKQQKCNNSQCQKGDQACKGKACDASPNTHGQNKDKRSGFKAMISQKLGFNEEQKTKFEAISKAHFEEIKTQHEEKRALKKKLFGLLKDDTFDEQKKETLIAQNLALEKKILSAKIMHFQSLKAICEPDQVNGLMEIIERMENKKGKRKGQNKGPNKGHKNNTPQ